jgi:hypothetical protein
LWLVHERYNPKSPHRAFFGKPQLDTTLSPHHSLYSDVLPTDFSHHPLKWSDEELAEASNTVIVSSVIAARENLRRSYEHLDESFVKVSRPSQALVLTHTS